MHSFFKNFDEDCSFILFSLAFFPSNVSSKKKMLPQRC